MATLHLEAVDDVLAQSSTPISALACDCSIPDQALALHPCSVGWSVPRAVTNHQHYEMACMWTPHAELLMSDPFRLSGPIPSLCSVVLVTSEYTPAVVVPTTLHGDGSGLQLWLRPIFYLTIGPWDQTCSQRVCLRTRLQTSFKGAVLHSCGRPSHRCWCCACAHHTMRSLCAKC